MTQSEKKLIDQILKAQFERMDIENFMGALRLIPINGDNHVKDKTP